MKECLDERRWAHRSGSLSTNKGRVSQGTILRGNKTLKSFIKNKPRTNCLSSDSVKIVLMG